MQLLSVQKKHHQLFARVTTVCPTAAKTPAELMQKHSGWGLPRPMRADQSEQTGLFQDWVLTRLN